MLGLKRMIYESTKDMDDESIVNEIMSEAEKNGYSYSITAMTEGRSATISKKLMTQHNWDKERVKQLLIGMLTEKFIF